MRKTEFYVDYDLYDTTAIEDGTPESTTNAAFADIDLLKENPSAGVYATLERNFFVLDGGREEFPDTPDDLAYFSAGQSGDTGEFAQGQSVTVQFTENHTSIGITLHFLEEYPLELKIEWYDLGGAKMAEATYYPDSLDCFCENQVEEYGKIVITFVETLPRHNAKLQYIEYGTMITWGSDAVTSGRLTNDTDPISDKIKTDKLTFDFIDRNEEFNIGNISGLHKTFQKRQKMLPYEVIDGVRMPLGVFFLDSNSTTKNVSKMSAIDYKGMLSNTDFKDGQIYEGVKAGLIIDAIMDTAGISDYIVDDETYNTLLYGTLKIQTCQKALREVLFACGSTVNTAMRENLEIHKSNRLISAKIERSRKFSTTLQTDHYVSDINVKYTTWTLSEEVSQITKGTYGVGRHTIQLSNPAANMTTNVGTIIKQSPYYIELQIDTEARAEVIISGQKYVGEELAVLSSIENIKSGEVRSTKTFTGTLLDYEAAQRVADSILDYYQLQQIIQTQHISQGEKAGDWIEVENTLVGRGNFVACIESLSTDLTGGFLGTAKYRGYYKLLSDYYYTGEIYSGEDVGII